MPRTVYVSNASMRPGHGRPGKLSAPGRTGDGGSRFNEAGAWSPRKAPAGPTAYHGIPVLQ